MIAVLMGSMPLQAQIDGDSWYDGNLCYSATKQSGGRVLMNAMAEGEEHEFLLIPVAGKTGTYTVADSPNDYVNVYSDITTVRHQKREGWNVLCFYDAKNLLQAVMTNEPQWEDAQDCSVARFKNQIMGEYRLISDSDEEIQLGINWDQVSVNLELAAYKVETFNGMVLGYITIDPIPGSTNRLQGTWEVVPTPDGIRLNGYYWHDGANWWAPDAINLTFRIANPGKPRFSYASMSLLNDRRFRNLPKSELRIMRNEILAAHGYRFQSKDLQEYFSKKPWYKPADSNDAVKLSFIEQLNVELIKAAENK